jgi:hypothetical protein
MTPPDESAVDGLASLQGNTRERAAPASLDQSISHRPESRTKVTLVRQGSPRRLARGGGTAEINEACAQLRSAGKHRSGGKRIDVELEGVGAIGATTRTLVVDDVDRTVRPHDHEIHAPTEDDRPTLLVIDSEHESDLTAEVRSALGDALRIGPAEEASDARDDRGVLRMLGRNALCSEGATRGSIGIDAGESRRGYPLEHRVSQRALDPSVEAGRDGTKGVGGGASASNVLGQPEHVNQLEAARAVLEVSEGCRRNGKRTPRGRAATGVAAAMSTTSDRAAGAGTSTSSTARAAASRARGSAAMSSSTASVEAPRSPTVSRMRPPTRNIASAALVMATYARRWRSARSRRRVVA